MAASIDVFVVVDSSKSLWLSRSIVLSSFAPQDCFDAEETWLRIFIKRIDRATKVRVSISSE